MAALICTCTVRITDYRPLGEGPARSYAGTFLIYVVRRLTCAILIIARAACIGCWRFLLAASRAQVGDARVYVESIRVVIAYGVHTAHVAHRPRRQAYF